VSNNFPKRHYLPAASIAYFSAARVSSKLRDSPIWVANTQTGHLRIDRAKNVAHDRSIYGAGKGPSMDFDFYFSPLEMLVHEPVERIQSARSDAISALDWLDVVSYVSSLFIRIPDQEKQFVAQAVAMGWNPKMVGVGYPLEFQRQSAAILRCRWLLVSSPYTEFAVNDRGAATVYLEGDNTFGYFVPLRRHFGILLGPGPYEKRIEWKKDKWTIDVPRLNISRDTAAKFNAQSWHGARRELYASSKPLLQSTALLSTRTPSQFRELATVSANVEILGISPTNRRQDEMLILNARSLFSSVPTEEQPIEWKI